VEKRKKSSMSIVQWVACVRWVEERRESLLAERPDVKELAQRMSEELKFPVHSSAIKKIKESANVKWNAVGKHLLGIGAIRRKDVLQIALYLRGFMLASRYPIPQGLHDMIERLGVGVEVSEENATKDKGGNSNA
jgi:hypothetical protein